MSKIPTLTPESVHNFLYEIGSQWKGLGVAVELGSWLGASAAPLLKGLVTAGYHYPFYAFDLWETTDEQVTVASLQGLKIKTKQDLRPLFLENTLPIYPDVIATKGRMPSSLLALPKKPIEICIFDAPKKEPVFSDCIMEVAQYWIPGVTILGLLDYSFYEKKTGELREKLMAPVNYITKSKDHFEFLKDFPDGSCRFFRYLG